VNYKALGVPDAAETFTDEDHTINDVFDFIQDALATEPGELSQDEIDKVRGSIDYET